MNRGTAVELDSMRLVGAGGIQCLVCDESNTADAETCHECHAPMVLAHQARNPERAPLMLAALGPSGVGKTVYLGMLLDMLSRQVGDMQLTARGGFSVNLQQTTVAALARNEFPSKTPSEPDRWNWVHGQIRSARFAEPLELVLPDLAGEALFQEVDHPRSYRIIHALLGRCQGVLVLVDAAKLQSGSLDEDFFTMKLLSHLSEVTGDRRTGLSARPVAIVFSKADQCETCFDDPAAYAERHAPGLWRICQQRFTSHRFFAAGVAGACMTKRLRGGATQSIPLRIEPRGIVEPFEWLMKSLSI
ncbi:MAG TPA: hypothetical protein VL175_20905 [Pirellulales bacterium]|jgi:hypothetical protein|nr:hypothetical protein [Pirellulales bacterium]